MLGQAVLSLVALLAALLFTATFSDYRSQNCEWSSGFGNCSDARGAMKTLTVVVLLAVIGLIIIRKGRA